MGNVDKAYRQQARMFAQIGGFLGVVWGGESFNMGGLAAAGSTAYYRGQFYRWDGGRWLDMKGIGADIPVHFSFDPFANAEPAEWGKPFPLWGGNANGGGENVIFTASHLNQMQLIQVGAFMEMNTELEIPLIDDDGNPLLDPAVPPCSAMRWNDVNDTDYVEDLGHATPDWTDANTSCAAYVGNSDATDNEKEQRMFSHLFRIEKTPTPHWVLRIHYAWNRLTLAGTPFISDQRTVLVQCIGPSSSNHASRTITSGSASTPGHYEITKCFWPDTAHGAVPSLIRANQPVLGIDEEYCPQNATTTFWLTDDGTSGGVNQWSLSYVPFLYCFGDHYFDQDRGTAQAAYRASSIGMGCGNDGVWQDHFDAGGGKLSIQHPDFDEYNMTSKLANNGTRWVLTVTNYDQTANAAGLTIGGGSAVGRHVTVHAFGVGA